VTVESLSQIDINKAAFVSVDLTAQMIEYPFKNGLESVLKTLKAIALTEIVGCYDKESPHFKIGWCQEGILIAVQLFSELSSNLVMDEKLWAKKNLPEYLVNIAIDTRNNKNVNIPTKHCHHFGINYNENWIVKDATKLRHTEQRPVLNTGLIEMKTIQEKRVAYCCIWIPAAALHGYDPMTVDQLGFCWYVNGSGCERKAARTIRYGIPYDPRSFPKIIQTPALWATMSLAR
jgi:hypothetical protein